MGKRRGWSIAQLKKAVKSSLNKRQVLVRLGLIPAGGNYLHVTRYIETLNLDVSHFTGQGWRRGRTFPPNPRFSLEEILVEGSYYNLHRLKQRLYKAGLKSPCCEECGWNKMSEDGRIPVEMDHINGNRLDNRFENLRVLCPNCHSLKLTHRGRNKKRRGGETGHTRDA